MCAHLHDGSVVCVGAGDEGQLGDGRSSSGHTTNVLVAASALSGMRVSIVDVSADVMCVVAETLHESKSGLLGVGVERALGEGDSGKSSKTHVAIQVLKTDLRIGHLVFTYFGDVCVSYIGTGDFDIVQCWGSNFNFGNALVDIFVTAGTMALAGGGDYPYDVCCVAGQSCAGEWTMCWLCQCQVSATQCGLLRVVALPVR